MEDDINEAVEITLKTKIKTPPAIDPGLPDIVGVIVLFGPKGRVAQVSEQVAELFAEFTLNPVRGLPKRVREAV